MTAGLAAESGEDPEVPWGRWFRHIDVEPIAGDVIMSGVEERPLLILNRVKEGRVAQLMSDQMWLWSRGFEGGGPQAELLRRISHWLMKEPDLEEEDLRARVEGGRLQVVRRSLSDFLPPVEVTTPGGKVVELTLSEGANGEGTASLAVEETGLYRVSDGTHYALAAAGPLNAKEYQDLRSTPEILQKLSDETGGAMLRLAGDELPSIRKVRADRDRHGRGWIGLAGSGSYVVTGASQAPLLPAVLVMLLALGAAAYAWYREGR